MAASGYAGRPRPASVEGGPREPNHENSSHAAGVALISATDAGARAGFHSLFDGKSFGGWEGDLNTFRIEAGAIVGGTLEKPIRAQ